MPSAGMAMPRKKLPCQRRSGGPGGTIYVVDALFFDNVQLFSQQGEFLFPVGSRGTELGDFWLPSGIFIDDNINSMCVTLTTTEYSFSDNGK